MQDQIYSGWLYAAVATPSGAFDGLFVTKDFERSWTDIQLPTLPSFAGYNQAVPTDSASGTTNYNITDGFGNQDLALTVDPTDPGIVYLGGFGGNHYNSDTGLIRVDATRVADAHSWVASNDLSPDFSSTLNGPEVYTSQDNPLFLANWEGDPTPYLNFIRNPDDPFLTDATLDDYFNYSAFPTNSGLYATWTPMDVPGTGQFIPPGR